jgi:hypothetical protein
MTLHLSIKIIKILGLPLHHCINAISLVEIQSVLVLTIDIIIRLHNSTIMNTLDIAII